MNQQEDIREARKLIAIIWVLQSGLGIEDVGLYFPRSTEFEARIQEYGPVEMLFFYLNYG
jgi:hypothetical protein